MCDFIYPTKYFISEKFSDTFIYRSWYNDLSSVNDDYDIKLEKKEHKND